MCRGSAALPCEQPHTARCGPSGAGSRRVLADELAQVTAIAARDPRGLGQVAAGVAKQLRDVPLLPAAGRALLGVAERQPGVEVVVEHGAALERTGRDL